MAASELFILKDHADLDVANKVVHYQYEDTLTEDIPSLILKMPAKRGKFLTVAPIIAHFDRIFARLTDKNGAVVEDVFEVLKIKPTEKPNQGRMIELICSHQSWYVWQDHFMKQYQRQSGFEVVEDILDSYIFSKGTSQPTIQNHNVVFVPATGLGNAMSQATFNDYDFGNAEKKDYDGILEVIDRLSAPISAKGEFEFYELRIRSAYNHSTGLDLDKMNLSIFVSGFKNGSLLTVDKGDLLNRVFDTDGNLEAETGFVIGSWAESDAGTLPVAVSQYFSEKEEFNTAKNWVDARVYKSGMRVQFEGSFFKSLLDHTADNGVNDPTTGIGLFWNLETFTPTVDYSINTKNRAQFWINAGLAPKDSGTVGGLAACFDANIIIRDKNHRRTLVDVVGNDPVVILLRTDYMKNGLPPRGFRVLVRGTGVGDFAGNDKFGKPFSNNWAQWDGTEWFVFAETLNGWECVDRFEGKSYTKRTGTWDIGAFNKLGVFVPNGSFDCIHQYTILGANNPDFGNTLGIEPAPQGTNSAVRVKYDYTIVNPLDGKSVGKIFCGINFAFPDPINSQDIPFGPATLGEIYLPDTLDRNNMHLSSKDQRGFVQGIDAKHRGAEDFGPLQAYRAWMTVVLKDATGVIIQNGDFTWRLALGDTSDNVIVIDKPHPHNNNTEELTWELNGAEIYRARPGLPFFPVKELEILNRFFWRNIKWGAIYLLDAFDDQGRFAGQLSRQYQFGPFSGSFTPGGTAELAIDAPHWIKPLLSISHKSETRPARNMQPQFEQHSQIFNKVQNDNVVDAKIQFHAFKKVEYTIRTVFRCDIKAGEHFYYTNTLLINTTVDGKINTEKVVAKKIIYTRTKGKGQGGRQRYIVSSKRFIAP